MLATDPMLRWIVVCKGLLVLPASKTQPSLARLLIRFVIPRKSTVFNDVLRVWAIVEGDQVIQISHATGRDAV